MFENGQEELRGYIPHRNGSNYDPQAPTPTLGQISYVADQYKPNDDTVEFVMVIVGKLYTGGTPVSGVAAIVDKDSIYNAFQDSKTIGQEKAYQNLLGLKETPIHITGVVLRPA